MLKEINYARIAQLVECNLAKVEVAGSNPVSRFVGDVAEWLGEGLQNLLGRFDSDRRLQNKNLIVNYI